MIWEKASFWRNKDGQIWHALQGAPQFRDLSMGVCHASRDEALMQKEYKKLLAWAKSHNLEIDDKVNP